MPPNLVRELIRHPIHARPLLFRKVGTQRDAERVHASPRRRPRRNRDAGARPPATRKISLGAKPPSPRELAAPQPIGGQLLDRLLPARSRRLRIRPCRHRRRHTEFPRSERDHRDTRRECLDQHPAELLTPLPGRLARRAQHIHRVQIRRHSSCCAVVTTRTRSPWRPAQAVIAASSGPVPTNSARQGAVMRSSAVMSSSMPFSGTNRPRKPTTGMPVLPAEAIQRGRPAGVVRSKPLEVDTWRNDRDADRQIGARPSHPPRSRPKATMPSARRSEWRSIQLNGGG